MPACAIAIPRKSVEISLGFGNANRRLGQRGRSEYDLRRRIGDLQCREGVRRRPGLAEDVLVRAEEDSGRLLGSELRQVAGFRVGAADDEIRQAESMEVDGAKNGCRRRPFAKVASHVDELVLERQDGVEHERALSREAPGAGDVEVAGVADDHEVEVAWPWREQPPFRGEDVECADEPAPANRNLPLLDLGAGQAQRGDRVDVSRMRAVVRAEIEHPHGRAVVVVP